MPDVANLKKRVDKTAVKPSLLENTAESNMFICEGQQKDAFFLMSQSDIQRYSLTFSLTSSSSPGASND